MLLPEYFRQKIKLRDATRTKNKHNLKLTSEITSLIQQHRADIRREHLNKQWDHKQNVHILWKTYVG